jgi:hypothetical protein
MPESNARAGHGSRLWVGDGASPEVFTDLAEVTAIGEPGHMHEFVEVTHATSPTGHKEFIGGGIKEFEELQTTVNWLADNATHNSTTGALKALLDGTRRNYRITLNGGGQCDFAAGVSNIKWNVPVSEPGKQAATITFRPSGAPTYTSW